METKFSLITHQNYSLNKIFMPEYCITNWEYKTLFSMTQYKHLTLLRMEKNPSDLDVVLSALVIWRPRFHGSDGLANLGDDFCQDRHQTGGVGLDFTEGLNDVLHQTVTQVIHDQHVMKETLHCFTARNKRAVIVPQTQNKKHQLHIQNQSFATRWALWSPYLHNTLQISHQ